MEKIRIMFVCHGNICRSPMAEFVMKHIVSAKNDESRFVIASSATSTEEIYGGVGNPVYPPAKAELEKHGVKCGDRRAVQLKKDDYAKYDLLIAMDSNNVRNIMRIIGGDGEHKVKKLLDFTSRGGDVADPWYTGRFDTAYRDIVEGCEALYNKLIER